MEPHMPTSNLIYLPTISPPTPAPSPRPAALPLLLPPSPPPPSSSSADAALYSIPSASTGVRRQFLSTILASCSPEELLYISTLIAPRLKRDFLVALPTELALHILSFVDSPQTLARASMVSRRWNEICSEEGVWRRMCLRWGYEVPVNDHADTEDDESTGGSEDPRSDGQPRQSPTDREDGDSPLEEMEEFANFPMDPALAWLMSKRREEKTLLSPSPSSISTSDLKGKGKAPDGHFHSMQKRRFSHQTHFKHSYMTMTNWRKGGTLLRSHRIPSLLPSPSPSGTPSPAATPAAADAGGVVATSLALDAEWVVIGLANSRIQVYSARTGVLAKTLVGHELGVWSVGLVGKGGWLAEAEKEKEEDTDGLERDTGEQVDIKDGEGKRESRERETADRWEKEAKRTRRRSDPDEEDDRARAGTSGGRTRRRSDRGSAHGTGEPSSASLEHLVPPSLRAAIGLDQDPDAPAPRPTHKRSPRPETKRKFSDLCYSSPGWGQPNSLVVSGGCDKVVMVWDVKSGHPIYRLSGHTSTIRCIRTVPHRPLAISGARDSTLRVWNIQRGRCERVLRGHTGSVRCVSDVVEGRVVSGSYDTTCRVWDIDTGECLHVLRGHFHQIYSVAFDGGVVASGGLDTSVRVWDVKTGECIALFQGHTALVCNLQLSATLLITGGSDGRVITFSLETLAEVHKVVAHDCSVTSLQFVDDCVEPGSVFDLGLPLGGNGGGVGRLRYGDGVTDSGRALHGGPAAISAASSSSSSSSSPSPFPNLSRLSLSSSPSMPDPPLNRDKFIVTSGNDGRVRLYEVETGKYVRDVSAGGESVWRVVVGWGTCVVVCKRGGKSVVEIWSMRAGEERGGGGG